MSEVIVDKIGCEFCKKMDELPEGTDSCPKVWSCKIYAKPGNEYKHFIPR